MNILLNLCFFTLIRGMRISLNSSCSEVPIKYSLEWPFIIPSNSLYILEFFITALAYFCDQFRFLISYLINVDVLLISGMLK
jgi:hypothetical protein